jgi:hypothetical protein
MVTQERIKHIKARGIDTDEIVYSICIGDIIGCIADVYGEDALSFSDNKLNELIEKGVKATGLIPWSDTIEEGLRCVG